MKEKTTVTRTKIPARKASTVSLVFKPGVTPAEVHAALDRIFEVSGCLSCGFLGFDVRLDAIINPPDRFAKLGNLAEVTVSNRGA